jgi:ubiquinol-cytochrome c reductase cytochrome c1 subunit
MKKIFRIAAALLTFASLSTAQAAGGGYPLDHFPVEKLTDQAALQRGAKLFVNYCLNCHAASSMRYNRLTDIGLTDEQIKANLLFTADKVGEQMKIAMAPADAKSWFGALPPDLSIITRSRSSSHGSGSDWLYTYLRTYYRDASRPTGWNNAVFPSVGMPHVLWQLQGARGATIEEIRAVKDAKTGQASGFQKTVTTIEPSGLSSTAVTKIADGNPHEGRTLTLGKAQGGQMSQPQYDAAIADLVAYVTYMSDPTAKTRTRMGVWVLIFLSFFTVLAWWLNREYWKDIK